MDHRVLVVSRVAPPIVFVLLVHAAVLMDEPALAVAALALVCALKAIAVVLAKGQRRAVVAWCLGGGLVILLALAAAEGHALLAKVILLPPIILNGLFLFVFGRTLLPGNDPLITRFSRYDWGTLTPELEDYTRGLTISWVVLFAFALLASVLLPVYADLVTWSWWVNLGIPAVMITFFLIEHPYRIHRFGAQVSISPLRTLRVLLSPDAWTGTKGGLATDPPNAHVR